MRTTARMKPSLDKILSVWLCMPDLRLGQMLMDAAALVDKDLFYMEEDELFKAVFELMEVTTKRNGK